MKFSKHDLSPMLATLVDAPFDDPEWIYEIKWDGFRLISVIEKGRVTLISRNGIDVTKKYPSIAHALAKIKRGAIIDGELVALDRNGISHFQYLQQYNERPHPLHLYVFDLLFLDGHDLREKTLLERKTILKEILPKGDVIRFSDHIEESGKKFFKVATRRGLEGIIGKRAEGLYYSGKRTREWLKVKCMHEQEAIIIGFTAPRKSRKHFGSLVLALHENGKLVYAGHSGGGFDERTLAALHKKMLLLKAEKPIAEKIPKEKGVTWIKPRLVCEVKFTEWTEGHQMRHPIFLGLRTDKPASKVIREVPLHTL